MIDPYSPLLLLAMFATAAAASLAMLGASKTGAQKAARMRGAARVLSLSGAAALILSAVAHRIMGHSAGSETPMDVLQFATGHPAVFATAIALFVVFGLVFRRV